MKLAGKLVGRPTPFTLDADMIRALAGLLSETGLTEIEYAIGNHRIRVAREPVGPAAPAVGGHAAVPIVDPQASPAPERPLTNGAAHPGTVTSPIVGVAYLAPEPGAAPFVRVGDSVNQGQTLLVIEAMKVMNQIHAPQAGRITRVFAEDAEPVEYGAALMLIE